MCSLLRLRPAFLILLIVGTFMWLWILPTHPATLVREQLFPLTTVLESDNSILVQWTIQKLKSLLHLPVAPLGANYPWT